MSKRVAIIAHGRLRSNRDVRSLATEIQRRIHFTEHSGHAVELAARLAPECEVLVVAGGDGTVNEAVNGSMQQPAHQRPAVCIMPLGSGNDVARQLRIRFDVRETIRRINHSVPVPWDVLRVEYTTGESATSKLLRLQVRYCVNVVSAGLGGRVAQLFTEDLRKLPGHLGYFGAIIKGFSSYKATNSALTFSIDGSTHTKTQRRLLVTICNSKFFGSGLGIAPNAIPSDGNIDIVDIGEVGVLQYLKYLPQLRRASPLRDRRISYYRATACSLESAAPIPVEIDGDFVGTTPISVSILQHAITFL